MNKIKKVLRKVRYSYRALPDKKQYVEFFTAALTVPMLLTVIVINLNNLNHNKTTTPTPTPTQERPIVVNVPKSGDKVVIQPTSTQPTDSSCIKKIAPISIDYPEENETVSDSPLQININYEQGDYCSSVWAYRINDGKFSDYDDKSIALYNVPSGTIRFQLKVKSLVTGETKMLSRTFNYIGSQLTPTASESAN